MLTLIFERKQRDRRVVGSPDQEFGGFWFSAPYAPAEQTQLQ
jgi:hypothetical protein